MLVGLQVELGQRGDDAGDDAAGRRAGVQAFLQRAQPDSAVGEVGDGSGHLGGGAAEPVERDDDDGVARAGVAQHGVQTRAHPLGGVGQLVGEHPPRVDACGVERRELTLEVLLDGAGCGVAQRAGHEPKVS